MSFTHRIKRYEPIPETIKVSLEQMDEALNTFSEVYAVMWIVKKLYQVNNGSNVSVTEGSSNKRRIVSHIWYKTFFCHRKGEKEQPKAALGGKSGALRPL